MDFFMEPTTIIVCIAIGFALSAVIMFGVRSKLKSVRRVHNACNYVRSGSFRVTNRRDAFLFSNISKTPRAQSNSGGGSGPVKMGRR